MITIKSIDKISQKIENTCYLLAGSGKTADISALKPYAAYIDRKRKDKGNQILRFIDSKTHIVVAVIDKSEKAVQSDKLEDLRKLGAQIGNKFNAEKAVEAVISNPKNGLDKEGYTALLEGLVLGNYQFDKYKSKKSTNSLKTVNLHGNSPDNATIKELLNVCESTMIARDLVNEPVIYLNTVQLSKEITKLSKKTGFSSRILSKAEITKLKMGGLLGVNRGSIDPPIFAILEWKPTKAKNSKPYVLVGKGVVYDTGGYSIKTGSHMPTMKCDMSGAAAVIGTINAIAKNKLPIHVVGLIPSTDNRIGDNALVPDDVITISDGTTVEVLNTDAEGRLILADALVYAKKYKPKLVIDLATLTGAASHLTGTLGSAMMGNTTAKEMAALKESGDYVYERLAELPFWREYGDMIKSKVADIKNIGAGVGGAITAGKFLAHFTDYPWIHLDIAGPAFLDKNETYKPEGGSGVGVRLLYHFLKNGSHK